MNGPIAQIVGLTCYGNAFLQGKDVGQFFPKNSTCIFCEQVTFVTLQKSLLGKTTEKEIAKTPEEWFDFIKSIGAKGIRLFLTSKNNPNISDRMSAGFVGGGGTWSMEVLLPKNRSEFWIARWKVWNQNAPERRIWRVAYGRVSLGTTAEAAAYDLQGAAFRLKQALRGIHSFSAKHDKSGFFTQCFTDALDTLDSEGKNLHGDHKDLAPDGFLPHHARVILDACQKAWVFGGMGSWNDLMFDGDDRREYERVSEQLFQSLNESISVGANESYYRFEPTA